MRRACATVKRMTNTRLVVRHKRLTTVVRYKYLTVALPITRNLFTIGSDPRVTLRRFDLDSASRGGLTGDWFGLRGTLKLVGGEQPAIRNAGAAIPEIDDAADPGLERLANFIEEVCQCAVIRSLRDSFAGRSNLAQFADIGFEWVHYR